MKLKLDITPDIVAAMAAEIAAGEKAATSALAAASEGAGTKRLSELLSRFRDVPSLMGDHEATARSLVSLLPKRVVRPDTGHETTVPSDTNAWIIPSVLAVIFIFILVVRVLTPEIAGIGD